MTRYMMATTAILNLGDISSKEPDLCVIYSEDEENYIGNWVTGFDFIDVKFPKATTRELTDEEKEKWNGQQIAGGGSPIGTIWTKEMPRSEATESPVIELPDDETHKQQLRDKLEEYRGRLRPYRAPELQMSTICKIAVVERLLKDGRVVTWDLSRELATTYGSGFDGNDFRSACGVIEDYCKTGGQNLRGGTGLRAPSR